MNQLTTTNNFTLEETLMQKVFEAFDYQFTIITPNDGEPHFIAKEVAKALEYSVVSNFVRYFRKYNLPTLTLTHENGLGFLKDRFFLNRSPISEFSSRLVLLPASSLQEYLLRYSTKPKAKELGDVLYRVLASGNPIFNEEVLDDWGTSIGELQKTAPQLFDASKKVNGFIFGWVGNRELANESKSWMSFLLSLAIKSVQIQFSTETRF